MNDDVAMSRLAQPTPEVSAEDDGLDGVPPEEATAAHWFKIAQRTRSVATRWRSLYQEEVIRSEEARSARQAAVHSLRKAQQEKEVALRRAADADKAVNAARQEKARWRARSDTQTASRVFLDLEETRARLAESDAALTALQHALTDERQDFAEYKASVKRSEAEREPAARQRVEVLMREREETVADNRALQKRVEEQSSTLSRLHAEISAMGSLEEGERRTAREQTCEWTCGGRASCTRSMAHVTVRPRRHLHPQAQLCARAVPRSSGYDQQPGARHRGA